MSFLIRKSERTVPESRAEQLSRSFVARLDRLNSAQLISRARQVYWQFLRSGGAINPAPHGVILQAGGGRVVFSLPTLLPDELFVPGDWLIGPAAGISSRASRPRSKPQPPCPNPQP